MTPMSRRFLLLCLSLFSSLFFSGCGLFSGVGVKTVHLQTEPPSRVTIYVSVDQHGDPIDFLDASNFSLYETDVLLDSKEIGLELSSPETIAVGHVALLVDLSGLWEPSDLAKLERGVAHFVEKVTTTQAVTLLGFDGSEKVHAIASFPRVAQAQERAISLGAYVRDDNSRDLNGSVIQAIERLQKELSDSPQPVKLGTVVVFTRGPDLAGRKPDADVYAAVLDAGYDHFSLTPADTSFSTLGTLGKEEHFEYQNAADLPLRFLDLGMRVRKGWRRHYLLSYCSPARAGERTVTIKVRYADEDGAQRSGSGSGDFSADGFSAGCKGRGVSKARFDTATPAAEELPAQPEPTTEPTAAPEPAAATPPKKKKPAESRPQPPQRSSDDDVVAPPSSGKYR